MASTYKLDPKNVQPGQHGYINIEDFDLTPELAAQAEELNQKIVGLMDEIKELTFFAKKEWFGPKPNRPDYPLNEKRILQYVNMVMRDCSDAVVEVKKAGGLIYRGMNSIEYFEKGRSFEGEDVQRKPKDSSKKFQEAFDAILAKAGFAALRGNSIFATGSKTQADGYGHGNIYVIFPINGFNFAWNTKSNDLHNDYGIKSEDEILNPIIMPVRNSRRIYRLFFADLYRSVDGAKFNLDTKTAIMLSKIKINIKKLHELFGSYTFDTSNKGKQQVRKLYEVLVQDIIALKEKDLKLATKLFGNQETVSLMNNLVNWLNGGPDPEKTTKESLTPEVAVSLAEHYGFRQDNLAGAIKSRNEILIKGAYYALRTDVFEKVLKNVLFGKKI